MTDEFTVPNEETQKKANDKSAGENWQEVGRQFQTMGEGLAALFHTAWQDENNRQRLKGMEDGLGNLVENIGDMLKETAALPEAKQVKVEAVKTAEVLRDAGEQTAQEVRPQLISALRQLNEEIQKILKQD